MLKISKLTDYGTLVMTALAAQPSRLFSAHELADHTGVGQATVSKLLKALSKAGLLDSVRGNHGGYRLAKASDEISMADIITALEGPIALTECCATDSGCDIEHSCGVQGHWMAISGAIRDALGDLSLTQLTVPPSIKPISVPVSALGGRG